MKERRTPSPGSLTLIWAPLSPASTLTPGVEVETATWDLHRAGDRRRSRRPVDLYRGVVVVSLVVAVGMDVDAGQVDVDAVVVLAAGRQAVSPDFTGSSCLTRPRWGRGRP